MKGLQAKCNNVTKDVTRFVVGNQNYTINPTDFDDGSMGNSGVTLIAAVSNEENSKSEFGINDEGLHLITLTVSDNSGHTATCNAHLTIEVSL